jgi:hypothetical protein
MNETETGRKELQRIIMEKYKNVHNGHSNGVSWEKPQDKTPSPIWTITQECQPSYVFLPATVE